jgi:glycosyltransferase involved in cell wall biosynthesis
MPLTVTIIAKNEADRIGAAVASAAFADEVLVVESGSEDDTAGVARAAGARVVQTDWPGHSAQKQRAAELARHDWIFSLDADERIDTQLAAELAGHALAGPPWGCRVRRRTWWQGAEIRHGTWAPDRPVRLFHRGHARHVGPDPHDSVRVEGPLGELGGSILHHPFRDVAEHLATIASYARIFAAESRRAGRRARWLDLLLRPPAHLVKALVLRQGLRDGARGLCLAGLGSAAVLLKWTLLMLPPGEPREGS